MAERDGGFSVVELLVVLSIMSVLMGLSAFALVSYSRAQQLTGATNQVLTDMRDAQARARSEATSFRVEFKPATEEYLVSRRETVASLCAPDPAPCWKLVESKKIETGIDLVSASWPSAIVIFEPRGVATDNSGVVADGTVVIRSAKLDQDREIRVTGLTARLEVR